jgi:hypothetical protein
MIGLDEQMEATVSTRGQAKPRLENQPPSGGTPSVKQQSKSSVTGNRNVVGNNIAGQGHVVGGGNEVNHKKSVTNAPAGIVNNGGTIVNPTVNNFAAQQASPSVAELKVNQRLITSTMEDAPYSYRVVLTTDKPLSEFQALIVHCDAPLTQVVWTTSILHNTVSAPVDGSSFRFSFNLVYEPVSEKFDPEHPLSFTVWSKTPVSCRRVESQ